MFIKSKENEANKKQNSKLKVCLILVITLLVMLIIILLISNRRVVLDKVGKLFNANETNKTVETMNNGTEIQTLSIENWDTEKVEIVEDTEGVKVPVPKGYVASGADGEHTVKTGFVIYEGSEPVTTANAYEQSKIRNQWVWVPVSDPSRIYERNSSTGKVKAKLWGFATAERTQLTSSDYVEPGVLTSESYDNEKIFAMYDMQEMTKVKLLEELENEFEATMASIEKYGGFYIGRYETGNVGSESSSNHNTPRQPVVQRMNINIKYVTWYDAYNNMKNIQRNENVKSNIIWGSLWDETLQWLVDSGSKTYEEIKNSVAWGNHYDSEFDYINANGAAAHKDANSYARIPTGSSEQNKANNIYDMAGNMFEWTVETNGTNYRRVRGGGFDYTSTPYSVYQRGSHNPTVIYNNCGVRAYFYIK